MTTENLPTKAFPIRSGVAVSAIVPQDIEQAYRLAQAIAGSGMAPKSYGTDANKVMVGIMHGMELGLTPMAALSSIAVINNQPAVWGDGMLALVRASGLMESFNETIEGEGPAMVARCRVKRAGEELTERAFSMADAKQAGLSGKTGPWTQYPKRMLAMRARSWALRDTFADVLKGLRMAEEVLDSGPARSLFEQSDGTYGEAPPPPTREQFTEPAKSYPLATTDGEIKESTQVGKVFVALLHQDIKAAIAEAGDVQALWDANYATLDQVRADNPGIDTAELNLLYNGWADAQASGPKPIPVKLTEAGDSDWEAWCKSFGNVLDICADVADVNALVEANAKPLENLGINKPKWKAEVDRRIELKRGNLAQQPAA